MIWPNWQWLLNQLTLSWTLTHNRNNEWEWNETWTKWWPWKPMDKVWLKWYLDKMKHENMKSMNESIINKLWIRVLARSRSKLCINQESQTKWEVNTSSTTKSWASVRVSNTLIQATWFMNLPAQELGWVWNGHQDATSKTLSLYQLGFWWIPSPKVNQSWHLNTSYPWLYLKPWTHHQDLEVNVRYPQGQTQALIKAKIKN